MGYLCIFEWVFIFHYFVIMESVCIIFDEYLYLMGTYTPEFTVCVYCNLIFFMGYIQDVCEHCHEAYNQS